jgi:hypothetical protein
MELYESLKYIKQQKIVKRVKNLKLWNEIKWIELQLMLY